MLSMPEQPKKAQLSINCKESGKSKFFKELHPQKALLSIKLKRLDQRTFCNKLQPQKAALPIDTKLSEQSRKTTLRLQKALFPI